MIDGTWEDFVEAARECVDGLDDLPERAGDFADSVREKLESMMGWAEEHKVATAAMWTALRNMEAGADRWGR